MTDFTPPQDWPFIITLKNKTGLEWIEKRCVSNQFRMNKLDNLKRYRKYFSFSFKIFKERKQYNNIIAWQQFYGIIISFFSRLLHVKKQNFLYIMTFIYKPKKGIIGKIYHSFIRYSISSIYADKIICFSSSEPAYYSSLFGIAKSKFTYVPLGEDLIVNNSTEKTKRAGVVSLGLSNRDYGFLINVFKELPYDLMIYADHNEKIATNISMSGDLLGEKVIDVLNKSKLLVIPLADKNISAGQLTVLHAMQLGVPVIATDSDGIRDFIQNNVNGYLEENNVEKWRKKISILLSDDNEWHRMSKSAVRLYKSEHTVKSMATNIAHIVQKI